MVRGEYEWRYSKRRTYRSLATEAPLRARTQPLELDQIECLTVDRQDRLGGVTHEDRHPLNLRGCNFGTHTVTLTRQRQYILADIHHASRRVRILGTTAHPTHAWVTQAIRNLLMDLEDTGYAAQIKFLIRDRDAKYPALIDDILGSARIATVLTGVRMPRMNSIIERWMKTLRAELLDRTLIWNQAHLRRALREYERHYNEHRTHRSLAAAAPLRVLPQPLGLDQIELLTVDRQDRLGGVIHEYGRAA